MKIKHFLFLLICVIGVFGISYYGIARYKHIKKEATEKPQPQEIKSETPKLDVLQESLDANQVYPAAAPQKPAKEERKEAVPVTQSKPAEQSSNAKEEKKAETKKDTKVVKEEKKSETRIERARRLRQERIEEEKIRKEKIREERLAIERKRQEKIKAEKERIERIKGEKLAAEKKRQDEIKEEKLRAAKLNADKTKEAKKTEIKEEEPKVAKEVKKAVAPSHEPSAIKTENRSSEVAEHTAKEKSESEGGINVSRVIFGHVADAHEWHLFSFGETHVIIPLPVIIYHPTRGLCVFLSSDLEEGNSYNGYSLVTGEIKEKIVSDDGADIYDLSITKNVVSMFISFFLLVWLMTGAAKKYKTLGAMKAPTGFQNALEAIIVFLRDEVAKPCLGERYTTYFPLLLTMFFFIWINNLLGLLPGGANFTGNIAVTACLAIISFIVLLAKSNKHFWAHLFNPPGVPLGIKFILVPIEILSLFIKPMALMIRLFANILAGHIMIIAVISMIFIFGALNKFVGIGIVPVSLAFSIFMFSLELLVGALQAYIFVNLSAVFIGQAIEIPEHHDHAAEHKH